MHSLTCLKIGAENGVKWQQNQTYDLLYVKKILYGDAESVLVKN